MAVLFTFNIFMNNSGFNKMYRAIHGSTQHKISQLELTKSNMVPIRNSKANNDSTKLKRPIKFLVLM